MIWKKSNYILLRRVLRKHLLLASNMLMKTAHIHGHNLMNGFNQIKTY